MCSRHWQMMWRSPWWGPIPGLFWWCWLLWWLGVTEELQVARCCWFLLPYCLMYGSCTWRSTVFMAGVFSWVGWCFVVLQRAVCGSIYVSLSQLKYLYMLYTYKAIWDLYETLTTFLELVLTKIYLRSYPGFYFNSLQRLSRVTKNFESYMV